ncbi:MAG TPA: hypothetical protein VFN10_02835 [Thermoanaerobaculia bacterium]|nr:hypothetical protein [Thermoanaerobaculia bacterium]
MAIDPQWIWIGLIAVAVIVAIALFARGARRSRTVALRDKFGNEYDHAVNSAGSRKRAEQELLARQEEVSRSEIRPVQATHRERYLREWAKIEQHFVDRPTMAVAEADELVDEIMRTMGYPMGDFEKHAAHLSVTHPRVVEHYRAGHKVITATPGSTTTEDLRQSMLHYRALFHELVGAEKTDVARDVPRANEVIAPAVGRRRDDGVVVADEDRIR